jgi:predicted aspartyl protease
LRLIPDSGASHVVLFDAGARALPPHHPGEGFVRLDMLGERRAARPVMIPELWIGPIVLRNQAAAVIDAGRRAADGLLPLHLFHRVTLNGPEGYVLLESW